GSLCDCVNRAERISPPSVLETIDKERADIEILEALAEFDSIVGCALDGGFVLSILDTKNAIDVARTGALEMFDQAIQGISASVAEMKRVELENQISSHAHRIASNQDQKRHELGSKMRNIVCAYEEDISEEARALEFPMDEAVLNSKWRKIAEDKLEKLEKDVHDIVARKTDDGEGFMCEDLLGDLGWGTSRDKFRKFIQGIHDTVQKLNGAAISGEEDRRAKEEAQRELDYAIERARKSQEDTEQQLKQANETYEATRQQQEAITLAAQKARDEALAAGEHDRQARKEAEKKMKYLDQQAKSVKKDTERVMGILSQVREEAAEAD
ncbi:unnamed protein product, partial [Ectocarpus fasciculatus]